MPLSAAAAAAAADDDDDDGRWAETNREQLRQHESSLEFKLHRLRFIEYVERGACGQSDAVQYAKNFAPFAAAHSKGLCICITCVRCLLQCRISIVYFRSL